MKARWRDCCHHKGVLIRQREATCRARGGRFTGAGTCRPTLEGVKEWIDRLEREGFIHIHQTRKP